MSKVKSKKQPPAADCRQNEIASGACGAFAMTLPPPRQGGDGKAAIIIANSRGEQRSK